MTVGFDTGSKWLDNYYEAYYEVIECYYKTLDKTSSSQYFDYSDYYKNTLLPAAKQVAASLKILYGNEYYNNYYKDYYKDYFNKNSWDTIWADYGYGDCDVNKITKKWGFSSNKKTEKPNNNKEKDLSGSKDPIISANAKFNKKSAKKVRDFNPLNDNLEIDTEGFGINRSATFAVGKNLKAVKKKLAKQDYDFIYDQKKGGLYFNENQSDNGFGEGGIIAILKGGPDLTADNVIFI